MNYHYIIQSGDTLSDIARAQGITQKALEKANPHIVEPHTIQAGDTLIIPMDAVLVSGTAHPATNAALAANSTQPIDSAVELCPLRADWFTIKPIRYAIAEKDSTLQLADNFSIGNNLPKLTQHKYIARELVDHTVYLYNEDDDYLLEVLYKEGIAQDARCVFGKAPQEVMAGLPIIKQKRNTKATMWLTIDPLSEMRLGNLMSEPDMILSMGQHIDFSQAAEGKAVNTRPLYSLSDILAELQSSETTLKWANPALAPVSDPNAVMVPYQAQTPDNHYSVCLVDAIGITTDLCREFSISYELVMSSISTSQHPLQIAQLTKHIIDNELNDAENKVSSNHHEGHFHGGHGWYPVNSSEEDAKAEVRLSKEKARLSRKEALEKCLHIEEMGNYLEQQKEAMLNIKPELEALAEDWLTWLKHEQLDLALSWLDDGDEEQIALKEAILMAAVTNIEAIDKGVELSQQWANTLMSALKEEPKQEKGAGAHFLSALGFAKPLILTGSKWLKALNDTTNRSSSVQAIANIKNTLLKEGKLPATPATDALVITIASPLVQLNMSSRTYSLWNETYTLLAYRYNYQFPLINTNMGNVLFDIEATHAVMMYAATGHITNPPTHQVNNQTVSLYAVNQSHSPNGHSNVGVEKQATDVKKPPSKAERHAQFWIKQVNGRDLLAEKTTLMKLYRKTEQAFTPNVQNSAVGLFFLVQVYNTTQINSELKKDSVKWALDRANAFTGLVTSSFAAIDQFAGAKFGQVGGKQVFTEFMKADGAELLGSKITHGLSSVLKRAKLNSQQSIRHAQKLGKWVTMATRGTFRWLPVVGGAVIFLGSGYQFGRDVASNQNKSVAILSGVSLLVNGFAAYCAWVALVPGAAPIMAVMAVVLAVTALTLEILRAMVMDDATQLFLKSSFWGVGNYAYGDNLNIKDKLALFSRFGSPERQRQAIEIMKKELTAFGDFLFKPIPQLLNVKKKGDNSYFELHILLPGFIQSKSDVSVYLQGYAEKDKKTLLVSHSQTNRWQLNRLNGKISMVGEHTAKLIFEVDEDQINSNYHYYELALSYHNPAGYPMSLNYPKIVIDDNKSTFEFWRNQTELNHFEREKSNG